MAISYFPITSHDCWLTISNANNRTLSDAIINGLHLFQPWLRSSSSLLSALCLLFSGVPSFFWHFQMHRIHVRSQVQQSLPSFRTAHASILIHLFGDTCRIKSPRTQVLLRGDLHRRPRRRLGRSASRRLHHEGWAGRYLPHTRHHARSYVRRVVV